MMRCLAIVFVFAATRAFSGEGMPMLFYSHWTTLTNTARFEPIHSSTNLPPEVRGYVLTVLGNMGVQAGDRKRMAEPGETLAAGSRLIWAVTDGNDYIVQYEYVYTPDSRNYYTNCCIAAGLRDAKDGTLKYCNGGYSRRFKDYLDLIDYDRKRRSQL
jgi:hypothetical protein